MATPICTILGGPNGSGKSSVYGRLAIQGEFLNADVIARRINPTNPEAASISAGRQILAKLAEAIEAQSSFAYETTLSSRQSMVLMRTAKRSGFQVGLIFVALDNAELNIRRVAERVARGGHHIPDDVIRRRYETALQRLPEAISIADGSVLFDNSTTAGPRLVVQIESGAIEVNRLDAANPFHYRLAIAVGEALSVSTDAVFGAARPD